MVKMQGDKLLTNSVYGSHEPVPAGESGHERVRGNAENRGSVVVRGHLALVEHRNVLAYRRHFEGIVAHQDGGAPRGDGPQQGAPPVGGRAIHGRQRLIQQQDGRPGRQPTDQRHLGGLPAREPVTANLRQFL